MSEEVKKKRPVISIVIVAALVAGGLYFLVNREQLRKERHYFTYFQNVDGLTISSEVDINGAKVGKVSDVVVLDSGLKVTIAIKPEINIPVGTTAKLGSAGISGGKAILLIFSDSKEYLPDEGTIKGIDEPGLMGENGTLGANIEAAKAMLKTGDTVLTELSSLFGTGARQDIKFQLNKLDRESREANRTSEKARGTGEQFAPKIASLDRNMNDVANDSKEWTSMATDYEKKSGDLAKSTASLGNSMNELRDNVKKLKPILAKANDKESALGKMLNDPQAYHTASKQLQKADTAAQDVMARPAAHWFAIFGKNR